jgi:hypothetical protein
MDTIHFAVQSTSGVWLGQDILRHHRLSFSLVGGMFGGFIDGR